MLLKSSANEDMFPQRHFIELSKLLKLWRKKSKSIFGLDEVELAVFFLVLVAEGGLFVGEVD